MLGIHRSCGGIHKNMEAPIGAVVESTRIWGRSLARATHGEREDEPTARGGIQKHRGFLEPALTEYSVLTPPLTGMAERERE
ncbi:hypothetical protein F2Q69_00043146 [Brassica cretica]|uniref:Uncharacterized protein n=1 Tax=Brassica cretica TaxID=69181 RepID=A0A8S9NLV8_BRACR|nr:hypothetical protein F2Q69_00043146 [Brassica cretica]